MEPYRYTLPVVTETMTFHANVQIRKLLDMLEVIRTNQTK